MEHQTLLIEDDRIAAVSHARATTIPGDVISVDGRGKFAIPGRWDSHPHITLYGESGLQALIESGITSIRDMGGDLSQIDSWPSEIHNRQRVGPNIIRAGPFIDGSLNDISRTRQIHKVVKAGRVALP